MLHDRMIIESWAFKKHLWNKFITHDLIGWFYFSGACRIYCTWTNCIFITVELCSMNSQSNIFDVPCYFLQYFCHYRIFLTSADRQISRNGVKAVRRRGSVTRRSVKNKMSCTSTYKSGTETSHQNTYIWPYEGSPLSLPYRQSQCCQIALTRDNAWRSPSPPSCPSVSVLVF